MTVTATPRLPANVAAQIAKARAAGGAGLYVLGDQVVARLSQSKEYLAEFPFLSAVTAYAAKAGGCGCNKSAADQAAREAFRQARMALATMPPERRAKLKKMLGQQRVVANYVDATGKQLRVDL